jgi:tetratricopeptide (TPR) repeat protein
MASREEGARIVARPSIPGTDSRSRSCCSCRSRTTWIADRLAAALRGRLGEEARWIAAHSRSLQPVTTSSLEALGLFSEALDVYADGDLEHAQSLLAAAVASDPDFAVAQARLFVVENARGRPEEALAALERAFRLRDRVTEPERYLIDVSYYTLTRDYDRALQIGRAWTAAYPRDPDGHRFLANTAEWVGYLPEALDAARRSAELLPTSLMNHGLLALLLAEANRAMRRWEVSFARQRRRPISTGAKDWRGSGKVTVRERRRPSEDSRMATVSAPPGRASIWLRPMFSKGGWRKRSRSWMRAEWDRMSRPALLI